MRKKEKAITNRAAIDAVIRKARVCRVAMNGPDYPYLVPLSFGYDGNGIFIHTAQEGKKIERFAADRRVCFEFEGEISVMDGGEKPCGWSLAFESVIGYGEIFEVTDRAGKRRGLDRIMGQYSGRDASWEYPDATLEKTRVWRIEIEEISGKRSPIKDE